jgi:phosphoribosylamine--glycine ligase
LMLTADGPKLIEYNVRFGDPETQVLLPRLKSDLLPALHAAAAGTLNDMTMDWLDIASVAVVIAARGYPGPYAKGGTITGFERAAAIPHVAVFHAGTDIKDGVVISIGGRVLSVCATGVTLEAARASAYAGVRSLTFADGVYRGDIGARALQG